MRIGYLFFCVAIALVGVAVYLGSHTRAEIAETVERAQALSKRQSGSYRGVEKVAGQGVGEPLPRRTKRRSWRVYRE